MSHVDGITIEGDFLENHKDLIVQYRNAHYYECQECHEWFDEPDDISQGWCKECREREQNDTEDQDEVRRQFREGLADTIKPPSKNV